MARSRGRPMGLTTGLTGPTGSAGSVRSIVPTGPADSAVSAGAERSPSPPTASPSARSSTRARGFSSRIPPLWPAARAQPPARAVPRRAARRDSPRRRNPVRGRRSPARRKAGSPIAHDARPGPEPEPLQALHDLPHQLGGGRRRLADLHAHRLQRLLLRLGGSRRTGGDGAVLDTGSAYWHD